MVYRVHRRTVLYRSIQKLRSITNSNARRKTSLILNATKYIRGLKQKLQELNQLGVPAAAQNVIDNGPMPVLKVETQEEGFMIKVVCERSCQGLLTFILEGFERLGLEVLQARASCVESFSLEAFGIKENNTLHVDAQVIEKVLSQAIQNWREVTMQC
ncbi:hypothetical protein PHAVU_008G250400 [Phaseolus vulgaris]|uniref:Plant bHLH transcription factor ACT-like domain-containing protein n=1 Tax=Phaseolus vulgaris TaxID=3885 RepID=V7BB32_PHAVU|nr:hypothetical protein PHAVU_008G250400g [Phaseolus vulgaris]ESW14068.1 hypothetical protein PHAVU_008G250400g [Phaseolus vulgaris]